MPKNRSKQCYFKVKCLHAFYPKDWILVFGSETFLERVNELEDFYLELITRSFCKEDFNCFISDKDIDLINKNTVVI